MERDGIACKNEFTVEHFNSHAHVERDSGIYSSGTLLSNFNSHAHVERDLSLGRRRTARDFNSHAHVERDLIGFGGCFLDAHISTHTLTWSVTARKIYAAALYHISTHTLTWSVTA